MVRYRALIPGVTGVVGRRLAEHLAADPDWEVIGMARRPPASAGYRVLVADLMDASICRESLRAIRGVTHVLYCARYDHTTQAKEPIVENLAMLRNVVDAVESNALQHVHLVQGTKYYGSDLGPFKTPAKESDPRVPVPNWYYAQEDFVVERSRGKAWTWSASRPHGICDHAPGIARSMAMVIAVYAAILRELGEPLCFPGTPGRYQALYQVTDATLLAKAIAWVSTRSQCAGQAFNVTNGDVFRWADLWPRFAAFFGMGAGPIRTVRLTEHMKDKGPVWDRIVQRYRLAPTPFGRAALWPYADFIFTPGYDMVSDTIKLRRAGFGESVDSEAMFVELFERFRGERIIP
jgi:nucleoside-diphosphate-sugar epimerase